MDESSAVLIAAHLRALGISLASEWDTLAFLHSHSASLGTAAQIARLIGYEPAEIGAALHKLEKLGLLKRSRVSLGTRIYTLLQAPEPGRHASLLQLLSVAQNRAGRLLLLKHLKHLKRIHQEPRSSRDVGIRLV